MITNAHIDRHLKKLELDEFECSHSKGTKDGNKITAIFPHMNYDLVRERIWKKKYYYNAVDLLKSTSDKTVCSIVDYHDGYDIVCDLVFERDDIGCIVTQRLRYIETYVKGKFKPVPSFERLGSDANV